MRLRSFRSRRGRNVIRGLHNTITRLAALRKQLGDRADHGSDSLTSLEHFGSNPGDLLGKVYIPEDLPRGSPLVVVLHGCTQSAGGYDRSAGWTNAARTHGFALLFPEQSRANNPNLCFNWFSPDDARRGHGESLSIRQMVATMEARHHTDPGQVFVTGLSAGGAMAAVMLATYPEVFAGGAIIAGLPFGTAQSVPQAFDRMRGQQGHTPQSLASRVRSASTHDGPWPTVSIWHGDADMTVDASNARAIVDQWRSLHGAAEAPSRTETVAGFPHRVWTDPAGRAVVEEFVISGMGHGTPLSAASPYQEEPAPFMLESGISSTAEILRFWGLSDARPAAERLPCHPELPQAPKSRDPNPPAEPAIVGVQATIENALRKAGLLR